jgi:uncharacterized protein (DUF1015 family)
MAEIVPFRGVRFTARSGAPLSALLAPHYHLVSPQGREVLLARDRHNIAHLTMGDWGDAGAAGGAGGGGSRYAGVAETWAGWLAEGVLRRDAAAALYPLVQTFEAPDGHRVQRRGFLAAVRLHELEEGVVIPHQRTLAAPRADRLELLRACRVNFTPVLGLYADERGVVAAALDEATAGLAAAEAETDDGVHHRLWQVDRPETVARLASLVEDQRLILADGHHRYETALAYRRSLEAEGNPLPTTGGHHYVLMCLCALSDPGLFVYPVHRLVRALGSLSLAAFLQTLERFFGVVTLEEDLRRPSGRAWAIARLAEHAGRSTAFLMVTAEDRKARILTLRDDVDLDQAGLPQSETLRMVDATVLHGVVLERMLGLSAGSLEGQELTYVNDAEEAVGRVLSGEHQLGFLVNPAPTWQVQAVAEDGKTLPPRSTLFRPVLQSGLVMREVDPRIPA